MSCACRRVSFIIVLIKVSADRGTASLITLITKWASYSAAADVVPVDVISLYYLLGTPVSDQLICYHHSWTFLTRLI